MEWEGDSQVSVLNNWTPEEGRRSRIGRELMSSSWGLAEFEVQWTVPEESWICKSISL